LNRPAREVAHPEERQVENVESKAKARKNGLFQRAHTQGGARAVSVYEAMERRTTSLLGKGVRKIISTSPTFRWAL